MKIEILGVGCAKCHELERRVRQAVEEAGLSAEIMKVDDMTEIMKYGVMMTPALVVDGKPLIVGKVPPVGAIKALLMSDE